MTRKRHPKLLKILCAPITCIMCKKDNGASTGSTPDLVGDLVHSGREQFSMVPANQGELSPAEGGPVGLDLVIFLILQYMC